MHVTALVKGPEHVCCRYRLAAYRPAFARAGCTLDVRPWPDGWLSRLLLRRELGNPDLLLLQRKLPPAWQLPLLRRAAPLLAFDFDDAVFLRDSYAPRGCFCPRRARAFAAAVRAADLVVAGNPFLQAQAGLWTDPDKIHLVPTCVDPARYIPAEHVRRGAGVQLVWIGSSSTLRGLEQARDILEALGARLPGIVFKVICDRFPALSRLRVLPCLWSGRTEAAELRQADIGLSWLPDDLWSRGKCGLKVLQYMAAGLPVVANSVGVQADLVRPGVTGFLVETAGELARAVARLAGDPGLRRKMGERGREVVCAGFSLATGEARWRALLGKLCRDVPVPARSAGQAGWGREELRGPGY